MYIFQKVYQSTSTQMHKLHKGKQISCSHPNLSLSILSLYSYLQLILHIPLSHSNILIPLCQFLCFYPYPSIFLTLSFYSYSFIPFPLYKYLITILYPLPFTPISLSIFIYSYLFFLISLSLSVYHFQEIFSLQENINNSVNFQNMKKKIILMVTN